MPEPKKVKYEENGKTEYISVEDAQMRALQKQNKWIGRGAITSGILAFIAILCYWASADWAEMSAIFAGSATCEGYRTTVLSLHDRGLAPDQIAAIMNLERIAVNSNGDTTTAPAPAYDTFYKKACGEVKDIVANLGAVAGPPPIPSAPLPSTPASAVPTAAKHR